MDIFFQTVVLGLGAGALDALLAFGIVLIFRTSGVLNFAQAGTGAFAAFIAFSIAQGRPLWLAFALAVVVGGAVGACTYAAVVGTRTRNFPLTSAVATVAVAILIQQGIRIGWGTAPGVFPSPLPTSPYIIGSVAVSPLTVASSCTAVSLAVVIAGFFRWSRWGTMIRALADNVEAAQLCGANITALAISIWALSGMLAAIAGIFVAQIVFAPSFLDPYFVVSLVAAVLGGLRSLGGAFGGAISVEIARDLFQAYAPATMQPYTLTFLILILIVVLVTFPRRWLAQSPQRTV